MLHANVFKAPTGLERYRERGRECARERQTERESDRERERDRESLKVIPTCVLSSISTILNLYLARRGFLALTQVQQITSEFCRSSLSH